MFIHKPPFTHIQNEITTAIHLQLIANLSGI